jgi:hypothetical protein
VICGIKKIPSANVDGIFCLAHFSLFLIKNNSHEIALLPPA